MKTKVVYTSALKHAKRIRIVWDEYEDGSLYIGLYTMSGEPYTDITKHLGYSIPSPLANIEANSEAEAFVKEQDLGTWCFNLIGTTWTNYRLYEMKGV